MNKILALGTFREKSGHLYLGEIGRMRGEMFSEAVTPGLLGHLTLFSRSALK